MPKGIKTPRAAYSIDWLQCVCVVPGGYEPSWVTEVSPQNDKCGNHRRYQLRDGAYYIRGYEFQKEVWWNNYCVAHIACKPRQEHLPLDHGAIKLENSALYVADWFFILTDILATLRWEVRKISRVDLCCDFNYFIGGLLPSTFLRNYICKNGHSYVRIGSNKFCTYGLKDMRKTSFDSIRWGSRQNGVSVYMYNKSRELKEVKNKPYIRALWKKCDLSQALDVWRVEISITSQGLGLKSLSDQMFHTLFVDDLKEPDAPKQFFQCYAAKYFRFLRTDPTAKRKRDLKEVPLLALDADCPMRPQEISESTDCGRMEKIISNRLSMMYDEVREGNFQDRNALMDAIYKVKSVFDAHHDIKDQRAWMEEKFSYDMQSPLRSAFHLPQQEAQYYALTKARHSLAYWSNITTLISKAIINHIKNAHSASPPPRTAVRNGNTPTTYPSIPTITPKFVSDFVASFFDEWDEQSIK